jgi:hydrogenase nickel incorporation protein HypB
MCKDCGCSIVEQRESHSHEHHEDAHEHNHGNFHHEHHHEGHHGSHKHLHDNPQLNDPKTISIISKILDKNDHEAGHNREHFNSHNVLSINLMSSPGSGKTALLEALADVVRFEFCVIEGDLETSRDADRLKAKGIDAHQIQTGSACHLDAFMVHKALHHVDLESVDVCFVENVGNLVCPASYDVGSHLNVVLVSIPEGEDKIAKYPVMFRQADLILFTKVDLLPYFEYDIQKEKEMARKLKPNVDILEVSTKDEESIKKVAAWIEFKLGMR